MTAPAPPEYVVESSDDAHVFTDRAEALRVAGEMLDEYRAEAALDGEWSVHVDDIHVYERRIIAWASVSPVDDDSVDYTLALSGEAE